jgi:DNA-binding response OmpR family regulator
MYVLGSDGCNPGSAIHIFYFYVRSDPSWSPRGTTVYILVVDDDLFANSLVQFVLSKEGYEVETTDNPRGALQMIKKREPDLLILDVKMPYINGFEFSAELRSEGYETPIIFMTAQDTIESKLQGFNIGADDYICKPYNHQELVARVQAVMRRIKNNDKGGNNSIRCGQIELFPGELKVVIPTRAPIILTPTEMHVLRLLMASSGQVVDRDKLLSDVWNDNENNSNIVDVYIRRLRLKLEEDAERPRHIISVRGIGYKFGA